MLLAVLAAVPALSAEPDAWANVPPLSTSCFPDDGFRDLLIARGETIGAEIERQDTINAAARERFENMDMAEKAQRMQAFMMENPQAAMAMLSGGQAAGEAAHADLPEASEASARLDAELKKLQTSFLADLDAAVKPVHAKQDQLIAAKTVEVGEVGILMFTAAADLARHEELVAEENAAREKACAPFFGADGAFHRWLAAYRAEVIETLIATEVASDAALVAQMKAMDLPGGGYRSTAPLRRAQEFLRRASDVYGVRPPRAVPWVRLKGSTGASR